MFTVSLSTSREDEGCKVMVVVMVGGRIGGAWSSPNKEGRSSSASLGIWRF